MAAMNRPLFLAPSLNTVQLRDVVRIAFQRGHESMQPRQPRQPRFGGPMQPTHPRVSRARSLRSPAAIVGLTMILAATAHAQNPTSRDQAPRPHQSNPLDGYIRDAIRANLSLAQDQLDEDRAVAAVREARALRLPSVSFSSRKTQLDGGLDLGDLVNPAYRALNQLTGTTAFPTN